MNARELLREQSTIDAKVNAIAEELNVEAICDGIISPEHYVKAPTKIVWVFREPRAPDSGNYDYKQALIERVNNGDKKRNKYFDPMRYIDYSLQNNLVTMEAIPDADEDDAVSRLLLNTAFINISKAIGGASVNYDVFWPFVDKFNDLVKNQLAIAQPRVIIASGTIEFFRMYGYLNNATAYKKTYGEYYVTDYTIIFNCYHLGARKGQVYICNDIINALKDAKSRGFLN